MTKTIAPSLGAGDVTIVLGGEEHIMKPTLRAAQTISRQSGGIAGAIQRVMQLDFDTVTQIITVGLGLRANGAKRMDLEQTIWQTGLTDDTGGLAERCITYLRVLASGGRMPSDDETAEDDQEPMDPPKSRKGTRRSSTG